MKALLTAIRTELRNSLTCVKRTDDIFITTDENVILDGVAFPCVGIKDNTVRRQDLAGEMENKKMQVTMIVWAPQGKDDAQVMGDATQDGVLDMVQEIEDALADNLLGISGIIDAYVASETPSRLFINERGKSVQQKTITFEFEREL